MPKRKPYQRINKSDRQSAIHWADGARETVLLPCVDKFADAMARGHVAERKMLKAICREYHAKIPWQLSDSEEPELPLPEYDPNAVPAEEKLTDEVVVEKRQRVTFLNKRIRRWLKYRVKKLRRGAWKLRANTDVPFMQLMAKLSGVNRPPKARSEVQQFSHENYDELIAPVVQKKLQDNSNLRSSVTLRGDVTSEMFEKLDKETKAGYKKRAKDTAEAARAAYKKKLEEPPSKKPEDRQKCIDNLGSFAGPILEGIRDATGCHVLLWLGGPIPKLGGEIGTRHVIVGTNLVNGVPFNRWRENHYENEVLGSYKKYLETAFTEEDKENAALPKNTEDGNNDDDETTSKKKKRRSDEDSESGDSDDDDEGSSSGEDQSSDGGDRTGDEAETGVGRKRKRGEKEKTKKGKAKGTEVPAKKAKTSADSDGTKKSSLTSSKAGSSASSSKRAKAGATNKEVLKVGPLVGVAKAPSVSKPRPNPRKAVKPSTATAEGDVNKSWIRPIPSALVLKAWPETEVDFTDLDFVTAWTAATGGKDNGKGDAEKKGHEGNNDSAQPRPADGEAMDVDDGPIVEEAPITEETPVVWAPLEPPDEAAEWFKVLCREFGSVDLEEWRWNELLKKWTELEGLYRYEDERAGLKASTRPAELGSWISNGRTRRERPVIKSVKSFGSDWWFWWEDMQPSWRVKSGPERFVWKKDTYGDDWGFIKFPGKNGVASLCATLFWWGLALQELNGFGHGAWIWQNALEDVCWVLDGLIAHVKEGDAEA
ncbi:hypothetical protein C8J56DRAFT_1058693 [Mycena floridula]|nr:hypothetical protein C8J56DRAFT_1058693 [Mycena floridula]